MVRVLPPNVPLFLTGFVRGELGKRAESFCKDVFVSNKFAPASPPRARQVVIRNDGGADTSVITSEPSVGVTVLAGSEADADNLAAMVKAFIRDSPGSEPGNPIAAVAQSFGPYEVPEESTSHRRYMTFTFSVVGIPLA